jgi:hypothetical protein
MRAADSDGPSLAGGALGDRAHEPRLSDAAHAGEQRRSSATGGGFIEPTAEGGDFSVAADEGQGERALPARHAVMVSNGRGVHARECASV